MGYHYYKFTRDSVVPEQTRVLAEFPNGETAAFAPPDARRAPVSPAPEAAKAETTMAGSF
jgi:hypothetical protein